MILVGLAIASLAAFLYPYVFYPLILRLLPRQPYGANPDETGDELRVALLFCAYNEERSLPAKLQNLRDIKAVCPELEIHAYSDCSTDGSLALLNSAADILTVHEGHVRAGKATGMRRLVESTSADLVIFTDANVIVDPKSVLRLVSYFRDPRIGTVAGTLHYTNPDESSTAHTGSAYWRLEEKIKRLESETGSTMGADGSLFAMRRSLYPTVPENLLDDMIASISPLFQGFRVVSAPDVHAFERATVDSQDEFRRKRRIACRAYNTHRHLRPQLRVMDRLNRFKYVSHKLVRWFSGGFLALCFVFSLATVATSVSSLAAAFIAGLGTFLFVLGLKFNIPVVSNLAEIAASIFATGVGVLEAMAGRNYQTWAPARGSQRLQ